MSIRIDPLESLGEATLSEIRLLTPNKEITYSGAVMDAAFSSRHQIETLNIDGESVHYRATGADPQLILPIPASIYYPSASEIFPTGI